MTTKTTLLLAVTFGCLFISGCGKMALKKYKVGRQFTDQSQETYFQQIVKENNFSASQLVYLDSASYMSFQSENPSASAYYASFINDSVTIKKTEFLLVNESCIGRIENEIEKVIVSNRVDTFLTDTLPRLSRLNFFRLIDNEEVSMVNNKKLTIVLKYFYGYGSYYKTLYKEIETVRQKHEKDCDVFIVCMEPIYIQHLKQ